MAGEYRPDVIVYQRFRTPTPTVGEAPLFLLAVGVNRQMEWKEGGQTFQGGQSNDPFNFPNLIAGSDVERDDATDEVLRPHVFLENRFGEAEVTPSYNWGVSPATFTLSPTLSAVFEVSEGTTGAYSSTTGKFTDGNADFIDDEVALGDKILVDDVPSFDVVLLINDGELDVTRINKAPGTWTGEISAKDGNDDRTFQDLTTDFVTLGFKVGDIMTVEGWDVNSEADGIDYTVETTGVRTMSGPTQNFTTLLGPVVGPPATIDIIWIKDLSLNYTPTFFVTGNDITATSAEVQNLLTIWPAALDLDENEVFEIFRYTQYDLTGGSVYTDPLGGYTALSGTRTFSTTDATIDFVTIVAALAGNIGNYSFAAADSFGVMRPLFKFAPVPAPTAAPGSTVQVVDWDPTRPGPGAIVPSGTLTWELWDDAGAATHSFLGADISTEDAGDLDKRTLTSSYNTFQTDLVLAGDTVYSDAGEALFEVTDIDAETIIRCINLVPGSPPSTWFDTEFGFYIARQTEAELEITRVVDENNLVLREAISGSPTDAVFTDLLYGVTVPNTMTGVNYTVEKTLSGSALAGEVLVSYMARRNDRVAAPFFVDAETYEEELGHAVPANPLAMAAFLAFGNLTAPMLCYQIQDDNVDGWEDAIPRLKVDDAYVVCPLTENETVLGLYRSFVELDSAPLEKREKILFQSHKFERIETRTTDLTGDNGAYTKTSTTTTITVDRDLEAFGVIVGDVFEGLVPEFSARIIAITSGATTTMTVVNDNGLPVGGPTPITDWEIKSKDLTDREYAQKVGAYPGTIVNRRYRNVYPDSHEITFTDTTDPLEISGFYGGGDVTQIMEGFYGAVLESAKRAQQRPAQSLTKLNGTGIHKILNPFGTSQELNDIVIDGGNYLIDQIVVDGSFSAVRAMSTDTTAIYKLEDSVTVQIDSFAKLLRVNLRPLLGPYNIDEGPYFDLVSAAINAVITKVVDADKNMRNIKFLSIKESETAVDTIEVTFEVRPYVAASKIIVTIFI